MAHCPPVLCAAAWAVPCVSLGPLVTHSEVSLGSRSWLLSTNTLAQLQYQLRGVSAMPSLLPTPFPVLLRCPAPRETWWALPRDSREVRASRPLKWATKLVICASSGLSSAGSQDVPRQPGAPVLPGSCRTGVAVPWLSCLLTCAFHVMQVPWEKQASSPFA